MGYGSGGSGGGGIGGATGATDNAIIRADGAGGSTVQGSAASVNDNGDVLCAANRYFQVTGSDVTFGDVLGTGRAAIGYNSSLPPVMRSNAGLLQFLSYGADVASAAAITPTGRVFHVTGTTNITSITSSSIAPGSIITIIFDGALTFTDGGNLRLNGNFVTTADDTITLCYDGTNWFEIARSAN